MSEQHKSAPLLPPAEPPKEFTHRVMAAIMAEPAPSWETQYDTAKQVLNALAEDRTHTASQVEQTPSISRATAEAAAPTKRSHHHLLICWLVGMFTCALFLYLLPEITLEVVALVTKASRYVVVAAFSLLSLLYTVGLFLTHVITITGSFLIVTTKLMSIWATLWQVATTGPLVGVTLLFGLCTLVGQTLVIGLVLKRPART